MAQKIDALASLLKPLVVDKTKLRVLASEFSKTFHHLALHSEDQFLPTPVCTLPQGTETGKFLAIDVGGTNLRVGFVELLGHDEEVPEESKAVNSTYGPDEGVRKVQKQRIRRKPERVWPIAEHLKMDQAEDLFAFIGDCIAEVVTDALGGPTASCRDASSSEAKVPLGVTFSFPMVQASIAEATLMPMGKGFAITSNLNLGKLLLAGYERHTKEPTTNGTEDSHAHKRRKRTKLPPLRIVAITNDTVATMASLAYLVKSLPHSRVAVGLIVGTGTNATVEMKLKDLHPSKRAAISFATPAASVTDDTKIVVNTEWTIRGTAPPLRDLNYVTKWDDALDKASEVPGFQPFEYMTAGRYLGELVRLILVDVLPATQNVTEEDLPEALKQRNSVTTTFLATVVASETAPAALIPQLHYHFTPAIGSKFEWNETSRDIVRRAAKLVQIRSSSLIAAAIVGLLACVGELNLPSSSTTAQDKYAPQPLHLSDDEEELVIAYSGGTISYYPGFLKTCQSCVNELVAHAVPSVDKPRKRVVLREAKDGGLIGAGVLAGAVSTAAKAEVRAVRPIDANMDPIDVREPG